MKEMPKISWK